MKASVIKAYTDRLDGKVHFVGDTVELTAERADELGKGGFVEVEQAKASATHKKTPAKRTVAKKAAK